MTIRVLALLGHGVLDAATPVLRADDLGATRGDGCFEGCRVLTDPAGTSTVDKLEAHLARLARSAAALDIALDEPAWRTVVGQACAAWHEPGEAAMKLVLTRGPGDGQTPTGYVTIAELPADYPTQRATGLRVITMTRGLPADAFAEAPWLLGGVKTLSYAVNMAAQREGERRGADDVIFTTTDGEVLESPTGSVVWSAGRTLHTTPTGATGILASTTQARLFENAAAAGWSTAETLATVDDLQAADTVWLVSTVRGPVDVIDLDGKARERDAERNAEIARLAGFGPR